MNQINALNQNYELVKDINNILKNFNIDARIALEDITITKDGVTDVFKQNAKLSNVIINFLWPRFTKKSVYHYTSKEAAEKILNTGIFRLTNIRKRYKEGEITTFYNTHNLTGYMGLDKCGIPNDSELIDNTFYASFTSAQLTKEQEEYFWTNFSVYDGVRLKIEIEAENHNFRKVYYEQIKGKQIPLLFQLNELITNKYKRKFTLKHISTLCSFYLSGSDYGIENEYRLVHRVWNESETQPKTNEKYAYIELKLDCMTEYGYKIKIVEVQAKEEINMPSSYQFSKRTI